MISPMSAFSGARSKVGTGARRAGDKVKRSSRLRDLAADLDAGGERESWREREMERERDGGREIEGGRERDGERERERERGGREGGRYWHDMT